MWRLVITFTTVFVVACAYPGRGTTAQDQLVATSCAPVSITAQQRNVSFSDVGVAPAPNSSLLSVISTGTFKAECNLAIRAFDGNRILLESGQTLGHQQSGLFEPVTGRYQYDTDLPVDRIVGVETRGFQYAVPVGNWYSDGKRYTRYLGVWDVGDQSEVRAFLGHDGRAATAPQPVLTSDWPIITLNLSSLPDAPMGTIHLVQQAGESQLDVTSLNWNHRAYFIAP